MNTYTIDQLVAGDGLTQLNASILQAQSAINDVSSRVDNLNSKSAVLRYNVPIDSTVGAGSLVYFKAAKTSTEVSAFSAALAKLKVLPGEQGESIEDPMSRVEGMIVSVNSGGTTGTLLIGGYWESAACAQACLGTNAVAGTYYLSPTVAGTATLDPGQHLRQPVLSYYGNGKMALSLFYMAHDNHFHASATMAEPWKSATELATEKSITAPTGAIWGYDHTSDSGFGSFGEMADTVTTLFVDGALECLGTRFVIESGYIWCKLASDPSTLTITVFNHYGFAYGSAIIRSIESASDALTVSTVNGVCRLRAYDYVNGSTAKSPLAVSAISGSTVGFTPVVSDITGGPGITIDRSADGSAVVSASDLVGSQLDAYSINNNGTTLTSDNLFTYITFPKSRTSEAVITLPVKSVSSGTTMSALAWAVSTGDGATFNVKLYYLPTPSASTPTTRPTRDTTPALATTLTTQTTSGFSYSETAAKYEGITSDGFIVAIISIASAPTSDIRLLRLGFKLGIVSSDSTDDQTIEPPETTTAVTMNGTAGGAISKYSAIKVGTDGKLYACTSQSTTDAGNCIGIALSGVSTGDSLEYMITGIVQDTNFYQALGYTPAPGLAIYVGKTGLITQTDPQTDTDAKYSHRVGTALTGSVIQINLGAAVVKED